MDSVVKLGHQIKGEPKSYKFVICSKLSILSFSVQKNHLLIVFTSYGHFLKINHLPRDSFLLQTGLSCSKDLH